MNLPVKESKKRIDGVVTLLRDKNLDCALIYYDELNISNGWYLSGWCPQFESGMILVPLEGEALILGGAESEPFAKSDSAIAETRNIPVFMVPEEEYPNAKITSFREVFEEIGREKPVSRIGIVGIEVMPHGIYTELIDQLTGVELVDITDEYLDFREIKSPYEIDQIQQSFAMADAAFEEGLELVKPGVSEYELAATVEYTGRKTGANGFGFKTIVATGTRSNGCVPTASDNTLKNGDLVLFGYSFRKNGYCCAVGDTFVVGDATEAQKEMLSDLAEAFVLTKEALQVGKTGKEVDAPAREYFRDKGYEQYLICPFAHTIGLNEAEAPFFGPNSKDVITENMAVCIDVSFFNHPVFHGVRVETGYRITADGPVPFSPYIEDHILSYRS